MRHLQLTRTLSLLLFVACDSVQDGAATGERSEPVAQVSLITQALISDRDGDGIADENDNCPSMANADQADRNGVGPGDACELSLGWSRGLLTSYARFQSHKELVLWYSPVLLTGAPDLLRVSAAAPARAFAHLSPFSQRLGVRSLHERELGQIDTVSDGEVLSLSVGRSALLGQAQAAQVFLHLEGNGSLSLTFFRGSVPLETQTVEASGLRWGSFSPANAELFDRVELRANTGSFALRGPGEGVVFALGSGLLPCENGYARAGGKCVDVDECAGLSRVCDALTTCVNLPGSFTCGACPEGYRGTGTTSCQDIDECSENAASCSPLATCSNTSGGYQCGACPAGYTGDGHTCEDVDECAAGNHACDPRVSCLNRPGGYDCGACPSGFAGGGQTGCVDIDECVGRDRACDSLTACTNEPGGFSCGACPEGYRGDGATSCVDIDECVEGSAQCSPLVACANSAGGYQCGACPEGYRGDGKHCDDVDECAEQTAQCSTLASCVNTVGGYQCGACPHGYAGDGFHCTDIDECQEGPCDPRTSCGNTAGSYVCSACPEGYLGSGYAGCVDVDECADGTDLCSPLVSCANESGSYHCAPCPAGYRGDGMTCLDIDECAEQSDRCDPRAGCSNHPGGYQCGSCPLGFSGDGQTCVDIDECAARPCDPLSICSNTLGSYSCGACPSGYAGDGYAGCVDVDECAVDEGGCPANEGCENLPGAMRCVPCAESSVGVVTSCGVGACMAQGVTRCERGLVIEACTAGSPATSDVSCDGRDDDCDGSIDEDFAPKPSTCGLGACGATGRLTCVAGQLQDSCVPSAPSASSDVSCDGRDDDCDGSVDEDFSGVCSTGSAEVCVGGQVVQAANCSDTLFCNGTELCNLGRCRHVGPAIDDQNPCTIDACSESAGITHVDRPFAASCSDGDSCNGIELCLPCRESENLLANPSFERTWAPRVLGEGLLPMDWWSIFSTPDTYSVDGSWGLAPGAYGHFNTVTSAPDGVRWVVGYSGVPERLAQELSEPLLSGQRYRISAKVHQAATYPRPGGYDVYLSNDYAQTPTRASDVLLGYLGSTINQTDWLDVSLEFVAPDNLSGQRLLVFSPRPSVTGGATHTALDAVKLVRACAQSGARSCQRQDAPVRDDGQVCTLDTCGSASGVLHVPVSEGTACQGSGSCSASGVCSNRAPVLSNSPPPYYVLGTGNFQHQVRASDADGDAIVFAKAPLSSCSWSITPAGLITLSGGAAGNVCVIAVQATDSRGAVSRQTSLLHIVASDPSPPMLVSQPARHAVFLGETFSYQPRMRSQSPGSAPRVALDSAPAGMSVDGTGLIRWTPSAAQLGSYEITLSITTAFGVLPHTFLLSVLPQAP